MRTRTGRSSRKSSPPCGHSVSSRYVISESTIQAGYREGITAGKEQALQSGFDAGFAGAGGVPLGATLGGARGRAAALAALLPASPAREEARVIVTALAGVRFADIVPPDEEAETHAREHGLDEKIKERRDGEQLEDMLGAMSTGEAKVVAKRPTMEDVRQLEERLDALCKTAGIAPNLS
jgi:hypothetical protein